MKMKKIISLFLAVILCFGSVFALPAYAEETEGATLTGVEIMYAPLKSRIVYAGFTDLAGMVLKLEFSDGTHKEEIVCFDGDGYKAGEYDVTFAFFSFPVVGYLPNYGITTIPLELFGVGDSAATEHTVLSIPSPQEAVELFKNVILNGNNPFWNFDEMWYVGTTAIKAALENLIAEIF